MASIRITAPSSAEEGERVSVSVRVTSTLDYHASYKATIYAVPDRYPDYVIGSISQIIKSGESVTRSASFTMPDCNTTVFVWVERWAFDHWTYDGSASKRVSLEIPAPETFHLSVSVPSWAYGGYIDPGSGDYPAYSTVKLTAHPLSGYQFTGWGGDASGTSTTFTLYMNSNKYVEAYFEKVPVPEYAGTITRKELDYQNIWQAIPLSDIPVGTRTRVRIYGRNDMSTDQKMGIYWFVADPDGYVVQEHTDWETFWTGPGLEQGFVGSGFDLSKVGKYTIWVELLLNPDDPQVVDRYIGDLCTVAAVIPEAEFRNFALSEYY